MNKKLLATSIALTFSIAAPSANAAFTTLAAGNYSMNITSGCFDFGDCRAGGTGTFTDNTANQTSITITSGFNSIRAVGSTVGSGISSDGLMGVISFSLDSAGNIDVTSYAQDSYLDTSFPYGTFAIDAAGTNGTNLMTGNIDDTGTMLFNPSGREAGYGISTSSSLQEWNRDINTGLYDTFTTSTSSNRDRGTSPAFTLTGSALQDDGIGGWTGTIVSAGNINGDNWAGFNNLQYSEVWDITITSAVPVPAAAWLFGSGLLGLIGVARRKHKRHE